MAGFMLGSRVLMEISLSQTMSEKSILFGTFLGVLAVSFFLLSKILFGFSLPLFLIFSGCLLILIWRFPEVGVYTILISTMLYERWFTLEPLVIGETLVKLYPLDLCLLLVGMTMWLRSRSNGFPIPSSFKKIMGLAGAAIFLWGVVSVFFGGDIALIVSRVKNLIFYVLWFWIVVRMGSRSDTRQRIVGAVLFGGVAIIGFLIYGFLAGGGLWTSYAPLSTPGVRLLSAPHAFFLLFPLLILLANPSIFGKWNIAIIAFWMIGIGVSLFRNLWVGCAAGIVILAILLSKNLRWSMISKLIRSVGIIVVAALFFLWVSVFQDGNVDAGGTFLSSLGHRFLALNPLIVQDESARFRLSAWQEAFQQFKDSPLLGIGFGKFLTFDLANNEYKVAVRELHNDFFALLLEMGIVGFSFLVMFGVIVFRQAVRSVRSAPPREIPLVAASIAFLTIFFFVLMPLGTYLETNFFLIFFWLAVGLLNTKPYASITNLSSIH